MQVQAVWQIQFLLGRLQPFPGQPPLWSRGRLQPGTQDSADASSESSANAHASSEDCANGSEDSAHGHTRSEDSSHASSEVGTDTHMSQQELKQSL